MWKGILNLFDTDFIRGDINEGLVWNFFKFLTTETPYLALMGEQWVSFVS